jgi:putative PIN family toxin of toxin-antitoxin system
MLRVVLDTDVLIAAFDSPTGASRRLVLEVLEGSVGLLISTGLMLEYEAVLRRPAMLRMIGADVAEIMAVLDEFARTLRPRGARLSLATGGGGSR